MEQNTNASNPQGNQEVQAGQPVSGDNPENIQQGAGHGEQQSYVSKAELSQTVEQLKREVQSLVDKNVSRVDQRVAEANRKATDTLEMLKASGMQVTAQQEAQIKNAAVNQALQTADPSTQGTTAPAQGQQAQQIHPVDMAANAILKATGVSLDDADPEIKMINMDAIRTGDSDAYLASIQVAASAKKARMSKGTGGAAATPGAIGSGASGGDLMAQYQKELATIPRGQTGAMQKTQLNAKYRKRGLNI